MRFGDCLKEEVLAARLDAVVIAFYVGEAGSVDARLGEQ